MANIPYQESVCFSMQRRSTQITLIDATGQWQWQWQWQRPLVRDIGWFNFELGVTERIEATSRVMLDVLAPFYDG